MKKRGDAIVLIGFMGAGKSSVGRALARLSALPRFDTDEMIAQRFGLTIADVFKTHGEGAFRDAETLALSELAGAQAAIVVTGGGMVMRRENRRLLRELGMVFHLTADEETLYARVSRRPTRPLLKTDDPRTTLAELLKVRLPLYREVADVEIDTTALRHDEVAERILSEIKR